MVMCTTEEDKVERTKKKENAMYNTLCIFNKPFVTLGKFHTNLGTSPTIECFVSHFLLFVVPCTFLPILSFRFVHNLIVISIFLYAFLLSALCINKGKTIACKLDGVCLPMVEKHLTNANSFPKCN